MVIPREQPLPAKLLFLQVSFRYIEIIDRGDRLFLFRQEQGAGKMVERQFSPDDLPSVQVDPRFSRSVPPPLRRPPPPPVSLEMRVFRGVFFALLAFSLLSAIGYAIRAAVVRAEIEQVQAQLWEEDRQAHLDGDAATRRYQAEQAIQQEQQAAQQEMRQEQAVYERSRYVLADDQRCVGGAVIQVDGNSYTQVGSITRPVHCTGRVADRPLR